MTKNDYLESQRGVPYTTIVANQPTETVVGTIRGDNLRDVVAVLAGGLQHRLDTVALPQDMEHIRTALQVAFRYMTLDNYGINLALPENMAMLNAAVSLGIVLADERDKFVALSSYKRPLLGVTREDCADYFGTGWQELPATDASVFVVRVTATAPEQTHVVVQMQDQYGDGTTSDWYHATALHGVGAAKEYTAALPHNGYPRKLRWKCEYVLAGTVAVR